jgi:hypothetical protein
MPVFARTKLLLHDYCFYPVPYATFNYSGPNPQKAYEYLKKLFVTILNVDEREIQEREFKWDRSGEEESFHIQWEIIKDLDTFSFQYVSISLDGKARVSKQFGKEGTIKIRVEPRIRTEYPQETVWQRSLIYEMFRVFYHRVIYDNTRKKYIENCRAEMGRFNEEMRSFFNLLPRMD